MQCSSAGLFMYIYITPNYNASFSHYVSIEKLVECNAMNLKSQKTTTITASTLGLTDFYVNFVASVSDSLQFSHTIQIMIEFVGIK